MLYTCPRTRKQASWIVCSVKITTRMIRAIRVMNTAMKIATKMTFMDR
jgi:hypothetical protein